MIRAEDQPIASLHSIDDELSRFDELEINQCARLRWSLEMFAKANNSVVHSHGQKIFCAGSGATVHSPHHVLDSKDTPTCRNLSYPINSGVFQLDTRANAARDSG